MGGLFIDILIAYLVKSFVRLRRLSGSTRWQLVQGQVHSSRFGGGWVWNCPIAEITYTYKFAGKTYGATDRKPFLFDTSAKERVERFPAGQEVSIRVNPTEPQESALDLL